MAALSCLCLIKAKGDGGVNLHMCEMQQVSCNSANDPEDYTTQAGFSIQRELKLNRHPLEIFSCNGDILDFN